MDRKAYVLKNVDYKNGIGLELGPLYSPILLKNEAKIFYVDHMSTDDLKLKYQDEPVPPEQIVEVDYVLGAKNLKETLGPKKFDYIIASHVIEHIPDMIRWFQDISTVLRKDGVISLVIPDKRFTFDITRNVSKVSDVVGAYLDNYTRASSASMFDFTMECRDKIDPQYVWNNPYEDYSKKPYYYSRQVAYKKCLENVKPNFYVDAHCNVFTPHAFVEIIKYLMSHGLFNYEVVEFVDTPKDRLEFYVTFKKMSAPEKRRQLKSLPKIKKDLEIWQLEKEIRTLKDEIYRLETSRSWKITKPLRIINSKANKLFP